MAEKVLRLENKHLVLIGAVLVVGFLLFSNSGITGEAVVDNVGKIKVLSVNKILKYKLQHIRFMDDVLFKKNVNVEGNLKAGEVEFGKSINNNPALSMKIRPSSQQQYTTLVVNSYAEFKSSVKTNYLLVSRMIDVGSIRVNSFRDPKNETGFVCVTGDGILFGSNKPCR